MSRTARSPRPLFVAAGVWFALGCGPRGGAGSLSLGTVSSGASVPSTASTTANVPGPSQGAADPADGPIWTVVAPRELPLPITSVAALDQGDAVVLANSALHLWHAGAARPVCGDLRPAPIAVEASGTRFMALLASPGTGGAHAAVVTSTDAGRTCARVQLPAPLADQAHDGIGLRLERDVAVVWNARGSIARSDDGGRTWATLPAVPGVVDVFASVDRETFAVVAPLGTANAGDRRRLLLRLTADPAAVWQSIDVGPSFRGVVEMQRRDGESAFVRDTTGDAVVGAGGRVIDRHVDPIGPFETDGYRALLGAGNGRFVALTDLAVVALDATGARAIATSPRGSLRAASAAVAVDGTLWVADGRALRRGGLDRPLVDVTTRTLSRDRVHSIAAIGDRIALVSPAGRTARSDDSGERWVETEGIERAEVQATAFDPTGTLLIYGRGALFAGERRGARHVIARIDFPFAARARSASGRRGESVERRLFVVGRRWVVVDGGVYTTDDQGVTWQARSLGATDGHEAPAALEAVFVEAAGLVLDAHGRLYRTDDGASTFHYVASVNTAQLDAGRMQFDGRLAWDGQRRIVIHRLSDWFESIDGGTTWRARPEWRQSRDLTLAPNGRVIASLQMPATCRTGDDERVIAFEDPETHQLRLLSNSCTTAHTAWRVADGWVYLANAAASVQRASLARLAVTRATLSPGALRSDNDE